MKSLPIISKDIFQEKQANNSPGNGSSSNAQVTSHLLELRSREIDVVIRAAWAEILNLGLDSSLASVAVVVDRDHSSTIARIGGAKSDDRGIELEEIWC